MDGGGEKRGHVGCTLKIGRCGVAIQGGGGGGGGGGAHVVLCAAGEGENESCVATGRTGFGGAWISSTGKQKATVGTGMRAAVATCTRSQRRNGRDVKENVHGDTETTSPHIALLLVGENGACSGMDASGGVLCRVKVPGARVPVCTMNSASYVWSVGLTPWRYSAASCEFVRSLSSSEVPPSTSISHVAGKGDVSDFHLQEPTCVVDTARLTQSLARALHVETSNNEKRRRTNFLVGTAEGRVYGAIIEEIGGTHGAPAPSAAASASGRHTSMCTHRLLLITDMRQPVVFIDITHDGSEVLVVGAYGDLVLLSSTNENVVTCHEMRLRQSCTIRSACMCRTRDGVEGTDEDEEETERGKGSEVLVMATQNGALVLALDDARRNRAHIIDADTLSFDEEREQRRQRQQLLILAAVTSNDSGTSLWMMMAKNGSIIRVPSSRIRCGRGRTVAAVQNNETVLRKQVDVLCQGLASIDVQLERAKSTSSQLDIDIEQLSSMLSSARNISSEVHWTHSSSAQPAASTHVRVRADGCPDRWIYLVTARRRQSQEKTSSSPRECLFTSVHSSSLTRRAHMELDLVLPSTDTWPRSLRVAAIPSRLGCSAVFQVQKEMYTSALECAIPIRVPDWKNPTSLALRVRGGKEEYVRIRGTSIFNTSRGTTYGCFSDNDDDAAFQIGFNLSPETEAMHINVIARDMRTAATVRAGILVRVLADSIDEKMPSVSANTEEDLESILIGLREMQAHVLALRRAARDMHSLQKQLSSVAQLRRDAAFEKMRVRCSAWAKAVDDTHARLSRLTSLLAV